MKAKIRVLGILLIVLMAVTFMPEMAFAEGNAEGDTIASGTCGDCKWSVDSNGVLAITAGEMDDWGDGRSPWYDYRDYIISVETGGRISFKTCSGLFSDCVNLRNADLSDFRTNEVTDMSFMFHNCKSLTSLDISSFDTSSVTDMTWMFIGCESLTGLDVSNFDTRNVTSMQGMFDVCKSLTSLDLSNFNTHKVTNMQSMFFNSPNLKRLNLSSFDTSNVTDMSRMFRSCQSLTKLDLSNFDTSSVTDMSNMFCYCDSLTVLDFSNSDISNVSDMSHMFDSCPLMLLKLGDWRYNSVDAENKYAVFPKTMCDLEDGTEYASGSVFPDMAYRTYVSDMSIDPDDYIISEPQIPKDAGYFNGHYYKIYFGTEAEDAGYSAASKYCRSVGGHLATISDDRENTYLYNYMDAMGLDCAYFGYTDRKQEGKWEWMNGEAPAYTNWAEGEPNSENEGEDYAMFYWKYKDGTWNDGDFDNYTNEGGKAYICEWDYGAPSHEEYVCPTNCWSFENKLYNLGLERYRMFFPEAQANTLFNAKEFKANGEKDPHGVCYGFSVTAVASKLGFGNPGSYGYGESYSLSDVSSGDYSWQTQCDALTLIQYGWVIQMDSRTAAERTKHTQDLNGLYNAVVKQSDTNQQVLIDIYEAEKNEDGSINKLKGHSLLPYEADEEDGIYTIRVYDCNWPLSEDRKIELTGTPGAFTGWKYNSETDENPVIWDDEITYETNSASVFIDRYDKGHAAENNEAPLLEIRNTVPERVRQTQEYSGNLEKKGKRFKRILIDTDQRDNEQSVILFWADERLSSIPLESVPEGTSASLSDADITMHAESSEDSDVAFNRDSNTITVNGDKNTKINLGYDDYRNSDAKLSTTIKGKAGSPDVTAVCDKDGNILLRGMSGCTVNAEVSHYDDANGDYSDVDTLDSVSITDMNPDHDYMILDPYDNNGISVVEDKDGDGDFNDETKPAPSPKPAHQHTYGKWTTTKAATELAAGTQTRKCSVCGSTETKTVAKLKPSLKAVKILKPKAEKKSALIKWKKISKKNLKKTKKVQIQYSTDKNFKKGVKNKYAGAKKTSYKIKKLKKGKKYYVRIRAYTKSGGKVHISKWSKKKSFRTK